MSIIRPLFQFSPKNKSKNETLTEALTFLTVFMIKAYTPPTWSLKRLEKYCKFRINKNPYAYFPRSSLAEIYIHFKKNEEAKEQYEEIKLIGEMRDWDWINFALVQFRLADYNGVINTLSPIINKYTDHKNANWLFGMSCVQIKDFKAGALHLDRLMTCGCKRYEDYWNLGYCYDNLGELAKAKSAYEQALLFKPDSSELKENIISINNRL